MSRLLAESLTRGATAGLSRGAAVISSAGGRIGARSHRSIVLSAVALSILVPGYAWAVEPPAAPTPTAPTAVVPGPIDADDSAPAAQASEGATPAPAAPARRPFDRPLLKRRPLNKSSVEPLSGVVYSDNGVRLTADIYVPAGDGPFPGVLVVHGGAWRSGSPLQMGHISQRLAREGYVAVSIRYRLAPEYKFPAQIHDCKAAIRWMRTHAAEYKIDPERIGAWGYSAGAHLVALLATTDPTAGLEGPNVPADAPSTRVKAVVTGGTPCDFRPLPEDAQAMFFLFGGSRRELPELYAQASPAAWVSSDDPPIFMYHGSADHLVPLRNAERMYVLLKQAGVPCELKIIPEAGHVPAMFNSEAARAAVKFLDEHLKGPAAGEQADAPAATPN